MVGGVDRGQLRVLVTVADMRPPASDELVAVLPADHPLAREPETTLAALAAEPFVLSRRLRAAHPRDVHRRRPDAAGRVRGPGGVDDPRDGLWLSVIPELSARAIPPRAVLRRLAPRVERRLGLAVPSLSEAPPAVRAVIEVAELEDG